MNRTKLKQLIFFFLVFHTCFASAQNKDTIYWNANRKIKWEDFKGTPDKTIILLAMTQAGIGYNVAFRDDNLDLKTFCYFNVNKSWAKEKDSDDLLKHEQLHFDITELYTRMLRKKISEVSDPCGKNMKLLDKIYLSNFNECAKSQDLYDKESNHSLNKQNQKSWEDKIEKELEELEKFSSENY